MDKRINEIASLSNMSVYDSDLPRDYIDGAPHIKHSSLRNLNKRFILELYDSAKKHTETPRVLDLGAGDGFVTKSFLSLGAKVVATDISKVQLDKLRQKCDCFGSMLELRCEDINKTIQSDGGKYDIIVAISLLHHIPDYIGMIKEILKLMGTNSQFFSFQDPMRYDTVEMFAKNYGRLAYLSWRLGKGDVIDGLKRMLRRARGIYLENSIYDNAEYHITRNGVDQEAIYRLFKKNGFGCEIVPYFSTQSHFFQLIGAAFHMKNTFAVFAKRQRG
jgi:SAM-dependent methyltransferase